MKRELSKKAKLSIFKSVFVPILTYGHESWVMIQRMRSQVQASEMRFLRRIEGVTLFNKVCSSEIRESLNIEPLLLGIERSQLRWFGHVSRMPQERLPKQALHAKANGRRPVGRPRTRWTDYIEDLGWSCCCFVVLPGFFRGMAASCVQRGHKRIILNTEVLLA